MGVHTEWAHQLNVKNADVLVIVTTKNILTGEDHLVNLVENVNVLHVNVKMEVEIDRSGDRIINVCKRGN